MSPRLSIVMPVWNGLPYLREAIESVLAQDFQDWELLIRDDGSTDGSRDYLASLADSRIKVFAHGPNLGIFGNLNFLFAQAQAPISQILCQDDYFTFAGAIGEIVSRWTLADDEIGFMRCNAKPEEVGGALRSFGERVMPEIIRPDEADLYFFLFGCIPGNLSNVSLRTALVERLGGFNQALPYAGDFDFWSRAARVVAFQRVARPWVHVRDHAGQASSYLNLRGELVPQLYSLVDRLFSALETRYDPRLLKLYAAISYDAQHRWSGVMQRLRGGSSYLRAVEDSANRHHAFPNALARWAFFLMSFGGRRGRQVVAQRLLDAHANGRISS
jgi:glycosyltransferase involved in cell wall biosynthesis